MKTTLTSILFFLSGFPVFSQYLYKDLVVTRQVFGQMQRLKDAGIRKVVLASFEADGQPTPGFQVSQQISNNYTELKTVTQTLTGDSSALTSYFNASGLLIRTIDTTDGASSITEYTYNEQNKVLRIVNTARSAGQLVQHEEHRWTYGSAGKPVTMLRIKNYTDTLVVNYVLDEQGNVAEENPVRNGLAQPSVFYYYDEENRLSDIVMYNAKAGRLLPVYVFEYNDMGLLHSMMVVPEGSDDYQKWYYEYNEEGLKVRERCFNKKKQLLGTIEYRYSK